MQRVDSGLSSTMSASGMSSWGWALDSSHSELSNSFTMSLSSEPEEGWVEDMGAFRRHVHDIVESRWFKGFILTLIILNTVLITLQTVRSLNVAAGWYLATIDNLFLGVYVLEAALKIYVNRVRYFRSGWNILDFSIVLLSFLEYLEFIVQSVIPINPRIFRLLKIFRALKALRALRVLRTISFLKRLQIVVSALLGSIPALGSIVLLLGLVLYIFAIIGRSLYGSVSPNRFGTLLKAFFSLFQLITLDDWFEFYTDVKDTDPTILLYLIVFIILETFIFINLFIAVLVNNLTRQSQKSAERKRKSQRTRKKRAIQRLDARKAEDAKALDGGYGSSRESLGSHNNHNNTSNNDNNATGVGEGGHAAGKVEEAVRKVGMDASSDRNVDRYYADRSLPIRDKQLMSEYFQMLAALEHNIDTYNKQQRLLDDLTDLVDTADSETQT